MWLTSYVKDFVNVKILKIIDLKFSVWYMLGSENETMFCGTQNVFQLPLSSFLFPTAGHLVFWKSKLISLEKKMKIIVWSLCST